MNIELQKEKCPYVRQIYAQISKMVNVFNIYSRIKLSFKGGSHFYKTNNLPSQSIITIRV